MLIGILVDFDVKKGHGATCTPMQITGCSATRVPQMQPGIASVYRRACNPSLDHPPPLDATTHTLRTYTCQLPTAWFSRATLARGSPVKAVSQLQTRIMTGCDSLQVTFDFGSEQGRRKMSKKNESRRPEAERFFWQYVVVVLPSQLA